MSRLNGKVALVTGGSRGIGAAIAYRLASEGADVAITYVNSDEQAQQVVTKIEATGRRGMAVQADAADPQAIVGAVDRAAAEFGRLDILVNNAGHRCRRPGRGPVPGPGRPGAGRERPGRVPRVAGGGPAPR